MKLLLKLDFIALLFISASISILTIPAIPDALGKYGVEPEDLWLLSGYLMFSTVLFVYLACTAKSVFGSQVVPLGPGTALTSILMAVVGVVIVWVGLASPADSFLIPLGVLLSLYAFLQIKQWKFAHGAT